MRVVCTNDGKMDSDEVCPPGADGIVVEGEQYNVIDSFVIDGYCWYVLEEDPGWGYDHRRFESIEQNDSIKEEIEELLKVPQKKKWYQRIFNNLKFEII